MSVDKTMEYMPQSDDFTMDSTIEDRPAQASSTAVQSGWDAAEKLVTASGD